MFRAYIAIKTASGRFRLDLDYVHEALRSDNTSKSAIINYYLNNNGSIIEGAKCFCCCSSHHELKDATVMRIKYYQKPYRVIIEEKD